MICCIRQNADEVDTVVRIVKLYYLKKDFCIITPYDGQRAAITKALKGADLPWEKVFNVDSFQGQLAASPTSAF